MFGKETCFNCSEKQKKVNMAKTKDNFYLCRSCQSLMGRYYPGCFSSKKEEILNHLSYMEKMRCIYENFFLKDEDRIIREILADPAGREKVKNDLDRYWRFLAYGQWDRLLYIHCPHDPEISAIPFAELVEKSGKEPVDVYLDAMMSAPTMDDACRIKLLGNVFHEQILVDSVIKDPIYMWQTDTHVYDGQSGEGRILDYMSMTQFFVRYVRDLGVISIQDAVKKVGSVPAQHYMLEKRGVLEVGNYADINVFDLKELKINATFTEQCLFSSGMDYVIVNGTPVIAKGEHTGARSGKVLRHLPRK